MKDNLHGHLSTRRIGVTPCSRFDVPSRLYWKPLRECKLTKLDWSCSGRPFKASHGLTKKLCQAQVSHLMPKQCLLRPRVSFISRDKLIDLQSLRQRQMDVRRSRGARRHPAPPTLLRAPRNRKTKNQKHRNSESKCTRAILYQF
jgi:hypothetical protein